MSRYNLVLMLATASLAFLFAFSFQHYRFTGKIAKIELQYEEARAETLKRHIQELKALNTELLETQIKHEQEIADANKRIRTQARTIRASISTGTISLRDRHATANSTGCSQSANGAAPSSDSTSSSAGREISRQTSENLVKLAEEADMANEALKQCIAQYESVRQTLKGPK